LPAPPIRDFTMLADYEESMRNIEICFRSPGFGEEKNVFPGEGEFGVILEPENSRIIVLV
jgi:hypothetical protein